MTKVTEKLCIKDVRTLKAVGLWLWQNRRSVSGYTLGAILACKWAFGPVTTDQVIELVKAMAGIINPVTLF